jgi:hypothetical protein
MRPLFFVATACCLSLSSALRGAEAAPPKPAAVVEISRPVAIGKGGADGFVAVGADGLIHVVFNGRYRSGPAPDELGPEESITDVGPVHGVRIAVDASGQPHVVFTTGTTTRATRSYYTVRTDGRWRAAEKFADAADFPERPRAYVADVAIDDASNVLVSFWVSRPAEKRAELENPSFYYRWRMRDNGWSQPRSLSAHWSSAPKVEFEPGRGFHLLWQATGRDWRVTGPIAAGGVFDAGKSVPTGSAKLVDARSTQNEGADFHRSAGGVMLVAGNVREQFDGPVGIWAAFAERDTLAPAVYLGGFPGTKRGDESGLHPVMTFDAATKTAFVTVLGPSDKRAYCAVHRPGSGWHRRYVPLLPDHPTPQGTLRQGPSVADLPGPGVLALVRDGQANWHLVTLLPVPE